MFATQRRPAQAAKEGSGAAQAVQRRGPRQRAQTKTDDNASEASSGSATQTTEASGVFPRRTSRNGAVLWDPSRRPLIWSVGIDFGEARQNPFREQFYYFEAGVIAIGGGDTVYFFRLLDGTPQKEVAVPEHFGHLDIVSRESGEPNELFLVLSWTGVEALDRTLSRVWVTEHIAVDGVCGGCVIDGAIVVHAEMDPPGGWFEGELDFSTGRNCIESLHFCRGT